MFNAHHRVAFTIICLSAFSGISWAQGFDVKVRGSLVVSPVKTVKIDDAKWDNSAGIEIFDLKVYAYGESTKIKFKLDLDTRSISTNYKIVEEALLTQILHPVVSITVGKGVVPFMRKHFGIVYRSFYDYGSYLDNFYWTYKDIDRKILTTLTLGSWDVGMTHKFTVYGDDRRHLKRDEYTGEIEQSGGAEETEQSSLVYDGGEQRGLTYRLDYYPSREWEFSFAAQRYHHVMDPHISYAFSLGGEYRKGIQSFWFESVYGKSAQHDRYEDRIESVSQIGYLHPMSESMALGVDINHARFKYNDLFDNANSRVDGWVSSFEIGPEYYISRRVEFSNVIKLERSAVTGDRRISESGRSDQRVERKALIFASSLSTFF